MDIWKKRLSIIEQAGQKREMRILDGAGTSVRAPSGDKIVFCSNDYLGLANHPQVLQVAKAEMDASGLGAGASRLVSGNSSSHEDLEKAFASLVGKPASVLFPSGYQANVGAIAALTREFDVVFSDELCHASIIDGCRLSNASVEIYNHLDTHHLEQLLLKHEGCEGIKLVVTEGIFSMDGDTPPLDKICEIAARHNALVYIDEAHSIGILGDEGQGLAGAMNLSDQVDVVVGTFGKAVGVSGAAVACSQSAALLLKSSARSLLYTTAAPPALCAAAIKSIELIREGHKTREALKRNIALFRKLATSAGLKLLPGDTPIQPLIVGDEKKTMDLSKALFEEGIFVQGIRPPTVKKGSSRLRITLSALHTDDQIRLLVNKLVECGAI